MSWLSKIGGREKTETGTSRSAAKQPRPSGPPSILIDRNEYEPAEFVLGSFRIRPYHGDLIAKQQFDFHIAFTLNEERVDFLCRGTVAKADTAAGLVARYQPPQPFYERKLVEYVRLWRGG